MTTLVSGGGTGGHITPILAVAHELKKLDSNCRIVYVGESDGKFGSMIEGNDSIDEIKTIYAGKFRRYHGRSWLSRIFDFKTLLWNIRDFFYLVIGFFQALKILNKVSPDVIFLKGGFVGVPIGLAASIKKIPFITHDSDALPGLANKLVGRWAKIHATGMPTEYYKYPRESSRYVGVLVGNDYFPVNTAQKAKYRESLKLPIDAEVLLITGGSLGAMRLNSAIVSIVPDLLHEYPKLHIIHQVGQGNLSVYDGIAPSARLHTLEFMTGMSRYTGASDVVVTRAGANTLAELGVQGKACVVVPNPMLTGGHQLINADYLLQHQAVVAVQEADFDNSVRGLGVTIRQLLDYSSMRGELGQKLQTLTKPHAAFDLAQLIIQIARKH